MKTCRVRTLSSFSYQAEIPGRRDQRHQDQLARIAVLLLVSSLCCPLHAQYNNDFVSSNTNVTTIDTKVVISAPLAIFTKSLDIFTTGIPIHPVYVQAPPGLYVWLSIQCKGGAARLNLPDYVANFSWTQTDLSGAWNLAAGTLNSTDGTYLVTGLGIKFHQNISVSNDVLSTLTYGKGADNDIAGKATMTITLNWNITIPDKTDPFLLQRSRRIIIWAPTSLTSISTFRATVAAICVLGIFIICCLGCLNTVAVSSLRRFSVHLARETRGQQECEQNRVFNPLWVPCAPTQAGYNNIESTPNPLMMMQRRKELQNKILRMTTPFSLLDRILRARHAKSSDYVWARCRCPCARAAPSLRDSSSDDERPAIRKAASENSSGCCSRNPSSDNEKTPSEKAASNLNPALAPASKKNKSGCCLGNLSSDDEKPPSVVAALKLKARCIGRSAPACKNCKVAQSLQMAEADFSRDSIIPRDSQVFSAKPHGPQQRDSQLGPTSTVIPALAQAQAPWRPLPQAATTNVQKYPAEPSVYLRNQYNRQGGPQGNRGKNENITVGYDFIQHRLAPSRSIHTDPNLRPENRDDFGAKGEILNPTRAEISLDSVSGSEVKEEIVAESDLEFGSELSFQAASNPGEGSSL